MKKLQLDPLQLDKQTIAKLDQEQLKQIVGAAELGVDTPATTSLDCSCISTCCPSAVSATCFA